jgi:hypothetical protein
MGRKNYPSWRGEVIRESGEKVPRKGSEALWQAASVPNGWEYPVAVYFPVLPDDSALESCGDTAFEVYRDPIVNETKYLID